MSYDRFMQDICGAQDLARNVGCSKHDMEYRLRFYTLNWGVTWHPSTNCPACDAEIVAKGEYARMGMLFGDKQYTLSPVQMLMLVDMAREHVHEHDNDPDWIDF